MDREEIEGFVAAGLQLTDELFGELDESNMLEEEFQASIEIIRNIKRQFQLIGKALAKRETKREC